MTKKEKAILKLAQKWARAQNRSTLTIFGFGKMIQRLECGRALLKILEGRD